MQLEARRDQGAHVVEAEPPVGVEERAAFEHRDRAHVHRRLGPLEVEEALVERGEAVVAAGRCHRGERRFRRRRARGRGTSDAVWGHQLAGRGRGASIALAP